MIPFQHTLWGYEIEIPKNWHHRSFNDKDGFAEDPEAFQPGYTGERLGHLLIHPEWNALQKPVETLWKGHISKTAKMLGAKTIASSPWQMAGRSGLEVEVALPQKSKKRLWAGVLEHGLEVLTFMVLHWKENRGEFEPLVTNVISSLRFISRADQVAATSQHLPLPPQTTILDPHRVVDDIEDDRGWQAYGTPYSVGALQAFYTRELPNFKWEMDQYIPFPNQGNHPFARLTVTREQQTFLVGLLPGTQSPQAGMIILREMT